MAQGYSDAMEVGVHELEARLSELLDRAEHGELITLTERGRPKAILGPLPDRAPLHRGIDEGWIRAPSARGLGPSNRQRSCRRALDILREDRSE